MNPESNHLFLAGESLWLDEEAAEHHTSKVTQIEDIVGLGWCWQQIAHGFLVDVHGGSHNHATRRMVLGMKILTLNNDIIKLIGYNTYTVKLSHSILSQM